MSDWHHVTNLKRNHVQSFAIFCRDNAGVYGLVFDGRSPSQVSAPIDAGRIQRAIANFLGNNNVRVSPPQPEDTSPEALSDGPFNFLISGISYQDRDRLLAAAAIEHLGDVIFISRVGLADPARQNYITSYTGFTSLTADQVLDAIRNLWRADRKLIDILRSMAPNETEQDEMPRAFLDSLWLEEMDTRVGGGGSRIIYNIHGWLPSTDPFLRLNAVRRTRQITIDDPMLGWIEVHPGFRCMRCHGRDHPSGLCPFPLQPEWRGPPPLPSQSQPTQTQLITADSDPNNQLIPDMPADPDQIAPAPAPAPAFRGGRGRGRGGGDRGARGGRGGRRGRGNGRGRGFGPGEGNM